VLYFKNLYLNECNFYLIDSYYTDSRWRGSRCLNKYDIFGMFQRQGKAFKGLTLCKVSVRFKWLNIFLTKDWLSCYFLFVSTHYLLTTATILKKWFISYYWIGNDVNLPMKTRQNRLLGIDQNLVRISITVFLTHS
jgi:hypothetical protein